MKRQDIQVYLQKDPEKSETVKAVTISENVHRFYKETALFYNVDMSLLITNILTEWMEDNKAQVVTDRIKKIHERGY